MAKITNFEEDSMLEIAVRLMQKKRRPQTLEEIVSEVFKIKKNVLSGMKAEELITLKTQFYSDFMLSGYFVCCGDDKHEKKLWDLKEHLASAWLEKDGSTLDDPYEEDEDIKANELVDEKTKGLATDDDDDDDDDDDEIEKDELAAEFAEMEDAGDRNIEEVDANTLKKKKANDDDDDDDAEEEDEIEKELKEK